MAVADVPLADVVLDYRLYPRHSVDDQQVAYLEEALKADSDSVPPILVDKQSMRIADGFHRYHATVKLRGVDGTIKAILKPYADDAAIFSDAMALNADHGKNLTPFDRARCLTISEELGISREKVHGILHWTTEHGESFTRTRYSGQLNGGNSRVPLKSSIRHMAGLKLTDPQQQANRKLSGFSQQTAFCNQLLLLLENDLVDEGNVKMLDRLTHLHKVLTGYLAKRGALTS